MDRTRLFTRALALLLLVAVAATGCADADGDFAGDEASEDEASADEASADEAATRLTIGAGDVLAEEEDEGSDGAPEPVDAPPVTGGSAATSGRVFVSSGDLVVAADDVSTTAQRAVALVEAKGGGLFAESTTFEGEPQAVLTLKVPPEEFSSTLRELGELGTVVEQSVETEDVTERVVDLESRIATASESVDRLQGFLGGATTVGDVTEFETQLSDREGELETLRAQLRTLEGRVDLATIVLTVREPNGDEAVADGGDDELPGFMQGLETGWAALVAVGSVLLAVAGALVPFLPFVLIGWGVVRLQRRRKPPVEAGAGVG